jgi:hypothetical protein
LIHQSKGEKAMAQVTADTVLHLQDFGLERLDEDKAIVGFAQRRKPSWCAGSISPRASSWPPPDVTIAVVVAIYNKLTLITDNLKHYPMKELMLYPLPQLSCCDSPVLERKTAGSGAAVDGRCKMSPLYAFGRVQGFNSEHR